MSRFMITYRLVEDPDPRVLRLIRERLRSAAVEVVSPGSLVVETDETIARAAVADLPDWGVSREGSLRDRPPSRFQFG